MIAQDSYEPRKEPITLADAIANHKGTGVVWLLLPDGTIKWAKEFTLSAPCH